jgi:hypothetical protein
MATSNRSKKQNGSPTLKMADVDVRDFHIPTQMVTPYRAASILSTHLGQSVEAWLDTLMEDRADSRRDEDPPLFPWVLANGEVWYSANDIYAHIGWMNPAAVGRGMGKGNQKPVRAAPTHDVWGSVDYVHNGQLLINLALREDGQERPLTPLEARQLARRLDFAADICESNKFDFNEKGVISRKRRTAPQSPVDTLESTGDAELDAMLMALKPSEQPNAKGEARSAQLSNRATSTLISVTGEGK